ncbi:MAG: hypothetical protein JJT89_14725 [Nitriliruptoraceae bacterium]|nr:hypothetical protein [Nitriliruptoraceae bacterium]
MPTTRPAPAPVHMLAVLFAVVALVVATVVPATAHDPDNGNDTEASDRGARGQSIGRIAPGLGAELAQARAATARFHDVAVAEAAGYVDTAACVSSPAGAMGIHYVHPGLIAAAAADPAELRVEAPQALLYLPDADGDLRLVGVEYIREGGGELFGQPFTDFVPGIGADSGLHVWLWAPNPAGMFAAFNPRLQCPN